MLCWFFSVQQNGSAICVYICIYPLFFWISFPFRSPQSTEQSSLWYTIDSHQLSVFCIISVGYIYIYIFPSQSPNSSHHLLFPRWSPYICSLHLCLNFCFVNKMWYIYTIKYYSGMQGNKISLFLGTWMDLETVILSEVNQKNKPCFTQTNQMPLRVIYNFQKIVELTKYALFTRRDMS